MDKIPEGEHVVSAAHIGRVVVKVEFEPAEQNRFIDVPLEPGLTALFRVNGHGHIETLGPLPLDRLQDAIHILAILRDRFA